MSRALVVVVRSRQPSCNISEEQSMVSCFRAFICQPRCKEWDLDACNWVGLCAKSETRLASWGERSSDPQPPPSLPLPFFGIPFWPLFFPHLGTQITATSLI
jgi:hypothetical protein